MAMHVPKAPGFAQMLKDGARHFAGLEEAVYRNVSVCKELVQSVRSAYGPNGMNKMVINHLDKHFVTSDAATIMRELDVQHPAAKVLILASQMQEADVGDGTAFVVMLAGALLEEAEELLRLGVTPGEVAEGYEQGLDKCLELLPDLKCWEIKDCKNVDAVVTSIRTSIQSKQYGIEDFLAKLIAKACVSVFKENTAFNIDNVRVCKVLGSGIYRSEVMNGMVFKRHVTGEISKVKNAKIVLYSCAVDIMQTETKGTVLIKSADELMNFSRGEEHFLEMQIKAIADAGATVIVTGVKFGDMALHFVNKYKMMAVYLNSKFDMNRLAKALNGVVLTKLMPPTSEELGSCDFVHEEEIADTPLISFKKANKDSNITTILVRGATDNYLDDIERAINNGVNTFKILTRDGRFVPGAGAVEAELARQLCQHASTLPGLEQYAVRKFAKALERFPKALAENNGRKADVALEKLLEAHSAGKRNAGVDIESEDTICDAVEKQIFDLYVNKYWGIKYAVGAATTILRVDQIIMAKRAGAHRNPVDCDIDS